MCDCGWNVKTVEQKVAEEMTSQTSYTVTAENVIQVGKHSSGPFVYATQCGHATLLCWIERDGTCVVQDIQR